MIGEDGMEEGQDRGWPRAVMVSAAARRFETSKLYSKVLV